MSTLAATPADLAPELPVADGAPLFDLVLRNPSRLSVVLVDEDRLPRATQKLLGLSLLGLVVHGLVVGASVSAMPLEDLTWLRHGVPALWMPAAFALAFVGALGICLPSFYFYTQLSGLDASFRLVAAQALRAQATTSQLLLGLVPFYAAGALAAGLGLWGDPDSIALVGLGLPFLIGLFGITALYRGFRDLSTQVPITHARRGRFLLRMVLCWGAVFSVVAPVALFRLIELFTAVH